MMIARWTALVCFALLTLPAAQVNADENRAEARQDQTVQTGTSREEDRQVIKNIELLSLMNLLKDMELLQSGMKDVPEETR